MRETDLKLFVNIPKLKTERLTLRKITLADYLDVYEYSKNPRVSEFLLWYPHTCISETRAHLRSVERRYKRGEFYDWGIEYEGHMIGTVGFTSLSLASNSGEIGYVIDEKFWGQGIASEAVREVIRFGFEELLLERIECRYLKENLRSLRLAERCHMKYEGCLRHAMIVKGEYRDVCISSILASEYFSPKPNSGF